MESFMRVAFAEALEARKKGDYPFGAVLVNDSKIVAQSRDRSFTLSDPTNHAELQLIREFCQNNNLLNLSGILDHRPIT